MSAVCSVPRRDDDSQPLARLPTNFSYWSSERRTMSRSLAGSFPVVGQKLPAAFQAGVGHGLAALEGHRVGGATGLDALLVEQVEQPPDAHPLAVFAPGVVGEVRGVAGQHVGQHGRTTGVVLLLGRLGEVPGLEVEGHDQGHARAVRPDQRLAVRKRNVIVFHAGTL
jgi:hypothetical protein